MKASRTGEVETLTAGFCYEFGTFRLDPARRRLETVDGRVLTTSTKAFDALQYFLEHPAKPIARRTLIEVLWPDTIVEENNLSQAISAIRRVLGDGYIVTVPGRGYQFVADVRRVSGGVDGADRRERRDKSESARSVWHAPAGLALTLALAIAVGAWIYVTRPGPAVNPTATLVENLSADEAQPGSAGEESADELDAYGVPGGTDNERANELYRSGKLLSLRRNLDGLLQAVGELERAQALDEDFALAQIALAQTLHGVATMSTVVDDIAEYSARFVRARDEVLERWPEVPAVRGLAAQRYISENRWHEAETALAEWVKLTEENDSEALSSYGAFLHDVGRVQDALPYLEKARDLNTDQAGPSIALSMAYDSLGRQDRAQEVGDKAMSLAGYRTMFVTPQFWRKLAGGDPLGAQQYYIDVTVAIAGWPRREVEEIARTRELPPGLDAFQRLWAESVLNLDDAPRGLEYLRDAYGNPELQSGPGMLNIALFAAHFGDINLSIEALRRSLAFDRGPALMFGWLPLMQPVRRHEEFKALMREIDIVDYWREWGWPDRCRPLRGDDFACT